MKNILLCCLLLVMVSCSNSQVENKWSSVSYMFESGPLPPVYQYSYTITINTGCDGIVVAFLGSDPSNPSLTYKFRVSEDSLSYLTEAINESKILTEDIDELPDGVRPVGGHLEKVRVIIADDNPNFDRPPRVKESPYFPSDKYAGDLRNLYKVIVSFVPQSVRDDFDAKKEEFQKNGK